MKHLLTLTILVLCLSVKAQNQRPYVLWNCKNIIYGITVQRIGCDTLWLDTMQLDTPHNDRRGDFNVICHGGKCDTVRNGIYEFNVIKKRLKKKGLN